MISLGSIRKCGRLRRAVRVVQPPLREKLVRLRVILGVIMDLPPIGHDDGTFWYEIPIIPIILDVEVVIPKLVDRTHTHGFFDHAPDVGQDGLVVECWRTTSSDNSIELLLSLPDTVGIGEHHVDTVVQCGGCRLTASFDQPTT